MKKTIILIPVFNDWQSLFKLLENINNEVLNLDAEFSIIIMFAFGKSIPTSITVVDTKISIDLFKKLFKTQKFTKWN